ncbi:hypothetical protein [Bacillus sp. B-jedd]|uniref:hypothetical protein n=1 Tax=Bacillus sp. B-jedd TaxID=1476857 RepID=UPI0005155B93|nr:hypothetical protein [Bacillus sp. B-jedd]CEG25930.1 hypothetical protein BN1002_00750 [Bacillus sp. B-jedd]
MSVKWGVNIFLGLLAFVFSWLFSFANNMWLTSLVRACIGFFIFFLFGLILQIVLQLFSYRKNNLLEAEGTSQSETYIKEKVLNTSEHNNEENSFTGISLETLHDQNEDTDYKKIAQAVKSWTAEEEGDNH